MRSDAELKEIMYELYEQEEGPVRNRKTHAVIPPMVTDKQDERVKFFSRNGLISDPLTLHRDSRVSIWNEEEKDIFRDKYVTFSLLLFCHFAGALSGTCFTLRISK